MEWIRSRLRGMWLVLHSPCEALACDLRGPSYLVPFVILSLFYTLIAVIQAPIQLEWLQVQAAASGTEAARTAAGLEMARRSVRLSLILVPILLMLRWLVHAFLFWLTAQVFLVGLSFSKTLTVVAYSYIPILFRDATTCLILCLRDREMLMHSEGLHVALGLNIVFPQLPLPWWALAGNVNFFEFWFIGLLVAGFSALGRVRWQKSLAVVLPVWLFVTFVQVGFVALGQQLRNQMARG